MTDQDKRFTDDLLSLLARFGEPCAVSVCGQEEIVEGTSVSWLRSLMKETGWRRLGSFHDFSEAVREAGFSVRSGRLAKGNRPATIVYL